MDKDKLCKKNIRWASGNYNSRRHPVKRTAPFHNFSDVEDAANAYTTINGITSKAGRKAAARRKRAGLPGIFIQNNRLITVTQQGAQKVVGTKPAHANTFYVKYQPATVLYAVKK